MAKVKTYARPGDDRLIRLLIEEAKRLGRVINEKEARHVLYIFRRNEARNARPKKTANIKSSWGQLESRCLSRGNYIMPGANSTSRCIPTAGFHKKAAPKGRGKK